IICCRFDYCFHAPRIAAKLVARLTTKVTPLLPFLSGAVLQRFAWFKLVVTRCDKRLSLACARVIVRSFMLSMGSTLACRGDSPQRFSWSRRVQSVLHSHNPRLTLLAYSLN